LEGRDVAGVKSLVANAGWTAFREAEESRYVALTLPRVLARLPYDARVRRQTDFPFDEFPGGAEPDTYVWMNAAWAYAARVAVTMARYHWPARTRGVADIAWGYYDYALPVRTFPTEDGSLAESCPTEIALSDHLEIDLSDLGFLPLLRCPG